MFRRFLQKMTKTPPKKIKKQKHKTNKKLTKIKALEVPINAFVVFDKLFNKSRRVYKSICMFQLKSVCFNTARAASVPSGWSAFLFFTFVFIMKNTPILIKSTPIFMKTQLFLNTY